MIEEKMSARHLKTAFLVCVVFIVSSLGFWSRSSLSASQKLSSQSFNGEKFTPANSTLGFGALLAVSPPSSPRRHALLQQANVTEIDITIPELPVWTEEDEAGFRAVSGQSTMTKGMIFAWLSHLRVLEWFLSSGLETALIMEDDMDWDIRLRSQQIPRVAAAFRTLFNLTYPSPSPSDFYYGAKTGWDILYFGHFDRWNWLGAETGVGVQIPSDLTSRPHAFIPDATVPPRYNMHPTTANVLTALDVPSYTRIIHPSKFPFGSWAYAVNRASAAHILSNDVAAAAAPKWQQDSLDNALNRACASGILHCWTVNPEIFHHKEGRVNSLIDYKSDDGEPEAVVRQRNRTGETDEISCGFASGDFEFGGNMTRLQFLRQEVGRKGRCLKPGREEA
ncbi:glycosyltransferase family 25 protein [Lepidopterella palustris CBS 459.81]|uniref:Glycosyltransferase family 25 protein n=1 Tax=Lepidopterella palustris CBS 459.81 TaxID=1314670 RepID=A0A8E2E3Q6_9PEZI|nr:glycosyltransferase family 25 protein [Lepidopterella palustris CBS 459.81]